MDLDDLEHNTRDGLHMASLAGVWTALVAGFGGMRHQNNTLSFAPRLPEGLSRLTFGIRLPERRLRVAVTPTEASYVLLDGKPLTLLHHDEQITASTGAPLAYPIPARPVTIPPIQPHGRAPTHRRPTSRPAPT